MPPERESFTHCGQTLRVSYSFARDGSAVFSVDGEMLELSRCEVYESGLGVEVRVSLGGFDDVRLLVAEEGSRLWVQGREGDVELGVAERFPVAGSAGPQGGLMSPMPGRVVNVSVAVGDTVDAGSLLVVIEAMKMEHRLNAPHAGRVAQVLAGPGDQVGAGQLLVVVDGPDAGGDGLVRVEEGRT